MKRVLSDSEDVVSQDVGPLLKAVVATNKFEREMAALFGGKRLKEEEEDNGLQVCGLGITDLYAPILGRGSQQSRVGTKFTDHCTEDNAAAVTGCGHVYFHGVAQGCSLQVEGLGHAPGLCNWSLTG